MKINEHTVGIRLLLPFLREGRGCIIFNYETAFGVANYELRISSL